MSDREEMLDAEIRDYLERETRENIEKGMRPEQARQAALRKLGPVLRVKEDTRAAWGWAWLACLSQDLRYGARMLRQNPGFSLIAILSIALGVGANCAMFSAADALVLRPLPVPRPDGVMEVNSVTSSFFNTSAGSYPDYLSLRDSVRGFRGLAALDFLPVGISTQPNALPQLKMAAMVSGNFFDVLEVTPVLGRAFRPDEDQAPGRDAVAVLSYGAWQEQFSRDRGVLGRKIRLNGIEFTVVGVAPERFTGVEPFVRTALYVPLAMYPRLSGNANVLKARDYRAFRMMGRLRPGVTRSQAQAEVSAAGANLAQAYPEADRNRLLVLRTELQRRLQDDPLDAQLVFTLLGLAVAVLCVACANVAGLLTSRAPVRAREMALRLAIGAGRGRLIRQLLTESALLAALGGLAGLGVGYLGILLFQQIQLPTDLISLAYLGLDRRVFVASLAATALSAVLFGLIPAIRTARADLAAALKARDAVPSGRGRFWGRGMLVSGQIAIALALLAATMFFYRGFGYSLRNGPGSRIDHLMMMSVAPSLQDYDDAKMQRFYDRLVEEAGQLSGAKSAALAISVPLKNTQSSEDIVPEGHHFPPGVDRAHILSNSVDEHYFEVMGIPIIEGRGFQRTDTLQSRRVAVVNQSLAQHYWPNQDPVGRRLRIHGPNGPWVEIAGVAKNTKYVFIAEAPFDYIYLPERQNPSRPMTLLVESIGDSASLAAPMRELIRGLDANMPIFDVRTMEDMYQMRAVRISHIIVGAVAGMGAMGLLLALVGLYGLAAYAVNRRTKEFGIRMAVGAKPSAVLRMVLGQAALLAAFGVAAGMPLAIGLGRLLRAGFPEGDADPAHSVLLALALFAVTLIAAYVPARRASRVDPTIALRDE